MRVRAILLAAMLLAAAGLPATPARTETVVRWGAAGAPVTFDPHSGYNQTTDVLDKSLLAAVLGWPGTGDRVALSGAAAASPAGSPHVVDPAALAAPVRFLPGFGRHDATRCS